jgi:signal transduction histidine kinase
VHYTKPQTDVVISLSRITDGGRAEAGSAVTGSHEARSARVGSSEIRPSMARIVVSDRGEGVPEEALPRLFEPFYRVSEGREHQTGGTGLGLSIAQRIAVLNGGTIRAGNRDAGGLEVEICLPVKDKSGA